MSEVVCKHNNHSHALLYLGVWLLWMQSCCDCSGDQTRLKNDIRSLDSKVSSLQSEVSSLSSENSRLRSKVQEAADTTERDHYQLDTLQHQVDRIPVQRGK